MLQSKRVLFNWKRNLELLNGCGVLQHYISARLNPLNFILWMCEVLVQSTAFLQRGSEVLNRRRIWWRSFCSWNRIVPCGYAYGTNHRHVSNDRIQKSAELKILLFAEVVTHSHWMKRFECRTTHVLFKKEESDQKPRIVALNFTVEETKMRSYYQRGKWLKVRSLLRVARISNKHISGHLKERIPSFNNGISTV